MTQDKQIAVGMVGFGLAGNILHAPVIEAVPQLRLAAVVTSRAEEVARRFPEARVLATPEALLADSSIDLVVVVTPNELHGDLARAALLAGKHVVVDKPFVVHASDGVALQALAQDKGRLLTVFHNRRWDSDFLTVRHLLELGRLGDVKLVECCWDRFRLQLKGGWREQARAGSGLLADLGPHMIDQVRLLFGWPEAVGADIETQREEAVVDDYFSLTLYYRSLQVRLSASMVVAQPRPRFALYGTKASFVKFGIDPQEATLRADGWPTDGDYGVEPSETRGTLTLATGQAEVVETVRGDWREFYRGVARAVLEGAPAPVPADDAIAGLRLIELARQSAHQRAVLPFTVE